MNKNNIFVLVSKFPITLKAKGIGLKLKKKKKVLLYNTGNYIQCPGIKYNGEEYEKSLYIYIYIYICMYNWVTLLYIGN